jgi:MoaA/NifB/PqqE/SkfB family radical SAM enzyme
MNELRPSQRNRYQALWEAANGVSEVRSVAYSLQFARTNTCNYKCVYCIDHRPGNQVPRIRLEPSVWNGLLKLIPTSTELGFHGISEFFVDPDFFDILQRSADAGVALSLNTNASVCTPRHLEALKNYPGFITITFSLDAASPNTFLRMRGQDFWHVVRNVRTYVEGFAARRSKTQILVSFVITRSNVHEMLPFLYLAKTLGVDSVTYFRLHEYEELDWEVEARHGGAFSYRTETVSNFSREYNRELEQVRTAAEILGVIVNLPAPVPEDDLVRISE